MGRPERLTPNTVILVIGYPRIIYWTAFAAASRREWKTTSTFIRAGGGLSGA